MSAAYQAVEMDQGQALDLVVDVTDDDGNAVDITGATITWRLARSKWSTTVLLTKDSAAGGSPSEVSLDPTDSNRFRVHLAPGDTADKAGDYWHEGRVIDADGRPTFVVVGNLYVRPTLG
ncbi:MAG: hypothetical protein AB7O45_07525 [Alphaproteobacteria bacterium]